MSTEQAVRLAWPPVVTKITYTSRISCKKQFGNVKQLKLVLREVFDIHLPRPCLVDDHAKRTYYLMSQCRKIPFKWYIVAAQYLLDNLYKGQLLTRRLNTTTDLLEWQLLVGPKECLHSFIEPARKVIKQVKCRSKQIRHYGSLHLITLFVTYFTRFYVFFLPLTFTLEWHEHDSIRFLDFRRRFKNDHACGFTSHEPKTQTCHTAQQAISWWRGILCSWSC